MARFIEARVKPILDILPQRVAVGLDDHAAAHGRVIRQVRALDKFVIPLRVIFTARGETLRRHANSLALQLTVRLSVYSERGQNNRLSEDSLIHSQSLR